MRISFKADVDDVVRDLNLVGDTIVPRTTVSTLNQISTREIEAPATRDISEATQLAVGVVRWKHNSVGMRTTKRRIIRIGAKKGKESVDWFWATRGGVPGKVSMNSIPGRKQTKKGVQAGNHFVPGAFINTSRRTNTPIVMKRIGKHRYPVKIQRVDITRPADASFERHVKTSYGKFRTEFERRLNVELNKARG